MHSSAYIFPPSNFTSSSNNVWNNTSLTLSNFTMESSASESPSSSIFSKATAFLADRQYIYKAIIYLSDIQIIGCIYEYFINRVRENIFRSNVFQVNTVNLGTIFQIVCHTRWCNDIINLQCRIRI